jgi:hypothetical protein
VKATQTAAGGTVSAKNQFLITDDTTWNRLSTVWIQSVRVVRWSDAGLYATFGTTPDRNILKNAIVGGSVYVPRWKTQFTGGVIIARGYLAEDLEPLATQFSDANGFALADVTAATLPLPKPAWQRSPYVSVSFVLAAF